VQELLHLAFQQAVDRDAGPLCYYRGDFFRIHLFFEQRTLLLLALQLQFSFANLVFKLADCAIAQARSFFQVGVPLGLFHFLLSLVELFFQVLKTLNGFFFGLPLGCQRF